MSQPCNHSPISCVPVLRKESQQIGLTEAVVDPSGHFVALFVVNRGRYLLGMSLRLIKNFVSSPYLQI